MKVVKHLHILAYIILLLPRAEAYTKVARWRIEGYGKRLDYDGTIVKALEMSPLLCGLTCFRNPNCKTFNAREASEGIVTCELLRAIRYPPKESHLQANATWNYYVADNLCPPSSVFVPYDVPDSYDDPIHIESYTCVNNGWIFQQHDLGKTDCRFQLFLGKEYDGYNAPGYYGINAPFYDALRACLENNCIGSICDSAMTTCWLKTKTPEETGLAVVSRSVRHFWRMVCNFPN